MTTEVSSGTAVLGIGIGRTPQALQSAIRAVAAIREGAYTTRRNSQLCLLISGRCDLILHAICPLLDPEQHRLGALSHRLRGLVTLSKFERYVPSHLLPETSATVLYSLYTSQSIGKNHHRNPRGSRFN